MASVAEQIERRVMCAPLDAGCDQLVDCAADRVEAKAVEQVGLVGRGDKLEAQLDARPGDG